MKLENKDEDNNLNVQQENEYGTITLATAASVKIDASKSNWDMYKGMVFMVFSCLGFTGISFFSKVLLIMKKDITSYEILTYRTYILFIGSSITILSTRTNIFKEENIHPDKLIYIVIRSILATFTISLLIYSIKYIDASDAYTIFYCYPAIVIISLFFRGGDKPKFLDYLCLVFCFVGVVCVVRPPFIFGGSQKETSGKSFYFLLSFIAGLTKATEVILVRDINGAIHFLCYPLFFAFFGLILFPIPMLILRHFSFDYTIGELGVMSCISISSWCYHSFLALSLENENAGRASMINYLQIPILLVCDLFLFEKKPNFWDIFGSMLIFTFNFGNGILKAFSRIDELEKKKQAEQEQQKPQFKDEEDAEFLDRLGLGEKGKTNNNKIEDEKNKENKEKNDKNDKKE